MKESTVDRIRSTIAGLCAGDAISWPSWWHRLHQLPPRRAVRLSEAHDHARTWRSSSVPTPYLHATAPSTIDPGGPTDDAEWFVVAVRHHLRQLLDGSAAPDGEGAWDQLAALRAADPDAVRGRIGVIASLGNLTAGLAPPASGHDNVHWFDDLACVRGVAAGLLRPGQADLAADLAEEDACITHALDGVWGARATAALVSCLVAGESRDAAIAAARAQLPQDSWIAAVVDECRAAIGGPGDTLARAARLERDVVDHVYAYANQAPETLGLLLAHLAVTESREGLLLAALGHPRHADALVPLAAAVAGAAFGSTGGGEPLPTLTGAIIPALAGTEMDTIVDLVQAAAAPTAGGVDVSDRPLLADRAVGCLTAAAVGDALGGATERWLPDEIRERWGGWVTGIVGPYHEDWRTRRPVAPFHKGDGHVTDDTLMTRCLVDVYLDKGDHLDAFDMADRMVPRLTHDVTWIPELEAETVLLQRVALAEKYLSLRLAWAHVDPREAGVGNAVNCGAAMYMAPVGIVNAADPDAAYAEAIALTGAHQSSFGREAAGVMAAAVAAAMRPDATTETVVEATLRLARDGTRAAIEAVCEAARRCDHWTDAIDSGALRDAIRPFDLVAEGYRDRGLAAHRPSRLHSIEELPIALGMLLVAAGDVRETILGGVNYGRDADSIASMGGAIAGAMHGRAAVPDDWVRDVAAASRLDLEQPGRHLADLAITIRARDVERQQAVASTFTRLAGV